MRAEILCVGTEILLGDIVNTNAAYIAKELAAIGVNVYHQAVVGDNAQRLREQLERSFSQCDLVVLTGCLLYTSRAGHNPGITAYPSWRASSVSS